MPSLATLQQELSVTRAEIANVRRAMTPVAVRLAANLTVPGPDREQFDRRQARLDDLLHLERQQAARLAAHESPEMTAQAIEQRQKIADLRQALKTLSANTKLKNNAWAEWRDEVACLTKSIDAETAKLTLLENRLTTTQQTTPPPLF